MACKRSGVRLPYPPLYTRLTVRQTGRMLPSTGNRVKTSTVRWHCLTAVDEVHKIQWRSSSGTTSNRGLPPLMDAPELDSDRSAQPLLENGFAARLASLARTWFLDPWRSLDAHARADSLHAAQASLQAKQALFVAAVCLTMLRYAGGNLDFFFPSWAGGTNGEFHQLVWWSGCCDFFYAGVPLVILLALRKNPLEYGLSARGLVRHIPIYVLLFAVMFPIVVAVSYTGAFQRAYPFYHDAGRSWPDFLAWEAAYSVQFISLEFFFRGFLLFSLKRSLGSNAIFAMMVPYCMIHFQKPLLECCGAIGAGIILGTLALRTGSIWLGAALHIAVAWSMDVLALLHRGQFPPGM